MWCTLLKVLDNTFLGTLLAGILLASFGLYLYRKQKNTDLEFEDLRKRKELASVLFSKVQIAIKNYETQLNIHNGKYPSVKNLYVQMNEKFNNYFKKETENNFNGQTIAITEAMDNLISLLKIDNEFTEDIEKISTNIPCFNLMLLGVSVMHLSQSKDIEELDKFFHQTTNSINTSLQKIINSGK